MFGSGSLVRVWFCLGSEYLLKIQFVFCSRSINIGFGFFIDVIGKTFPWWSSVMN